MEKLKVFLERQGSSWFLKFDPSIFNGGVDEDAIREAIEKYLEEHPIEIDTDKFVLVDQGADKGERFLVTDESGKVVVLPLDNDFFRNMLIESITLPPIHWTPTGYQDNCVILCRSGDIVSFYINQTVNCPTSMSTNQIPYGYRPMTDMINLFTGMQPGTGASRPSFFTILSDGRVQGSIENVAPVQIAISYVTGDTYPSITDNGNR